MRGKEYRRVPSPLLAPRTPSTDATGSPAVRPPVKPPAPGGVGARVRSLAGVKLSKDGKSVFNYNPQKLQSGINWALAWWFLPGIFSKWWFLQLACLYAWMHIWSMYISDTRAPSSMVMRDYGPGAAVDPDRQGVIDALAHRYYDQVASLTRFVLGLYVSLALAKTYYANRREFGTLFGRSMGFSQMVAAWVRAPPPSAGSGGSAARQQQQEAGENALRAQLLLVRWVNAAFRLLVLEVRDWDAEEIGAELVERHQLLTRDEWEHIEGITSRATHIYQWINNVLYDLLCAGYIKDTVLLNRMHEQIDDMRAANVWGLPSLPIVYVQLITTMVKLHLFALACKQGGELQTCNQLHWRAGEWNIGMLVMIHATLLLEHFLYQGLLDLHGCLYSPNGGLLLGHMPADNFLDFVQTVTTELVDRNCALPYTLGLKGAADN